MRKTARENRHCCSRFRESVKEGKFVHSSGLDETEWFMPEWLHIYFCPFCGTHVKGKGTGTFDKKRAASRARRERGG